jgi:hypothetical protein
MVKRGRQIQKSGLGDLRRMTLKALRGTAGLFHVSYVHSALGKPDAWVQNAPFHIRPDTAFPHGRH